MSYYAVRKGFKPGIYLTWSEAEKQVKGFPGARHKKFKIESEALEFINSESPNKKHQNDYNASLDKDIEINSKVKKIPENNLRKRKLNQLIESDININVTIKSNSLKNNSRKRKKIENIIVLDDSRSNEDDDDDKSSFTTVYFYERRTRPMIVVHYYLNQMNFFASKALTLNKSTANKKTKENDSEDSVIKEKATKKPRVSKKTKEPVNKPKLKAKASEPKTKKATATKWKKKEDIYSSLIPSMTNFLPELASSTPKTPSINRQNDYFNEYSVKKINFSFDKDKKVTVFTDGACSSNGTKSAAGGIGVFWGPNHPLNVSRQLEGNPTNIRAEIIAASVAISQAITYGVGELILMTDSQFTINCMTQWIEKWKKNNWKTASGEHVKNIEDLKKLDELCSKIKVKWTFIEAHKGHFGNEEADKLARKGAMLNQIN